MAVVTPRVTRLVRVATLRAFREAVCTLACDGSPLSARDRLVIVPTRAASAHLVRSIERRMLSDGKAVVLPRLVTPRELLPSFAERVPPGRPVLLDVEREALLGVACRHVAATGVEPPFRLRPALVSAMLDLYDTLERNQKDVRAFERLALARLQPGAEIDRGARRLVRQTQFLALAFAEFERRSSEYGLDDRALRQRLIGEPSTRPIRHVIVTVGDHAIDRHGLYAADWDLLACVPNLERLDVVTTEGVLAGAFHERIHTLLPEIEETRFDAHEDRTPVLMRPASGGLVHATRDREDEIAGFARRAKRAARAGRPLDRMAMVVQRPLPYVYLSQEILRAGGVPCQMFDALPLAAEPYAAALDVMLAAVLSNFTRPTAIALLRSPHFRFTTGDGELEARGIAQLDRALRDAGHLEGMQALESIVEALSEPMSPGGEGAVQTAGRQLVAVCKELEPLRTPAPAATQLSLLKDALIRHERLPAADDPRSARLLRARAAVLAALGALRDAYARVDQTPIAFDELAALLRRRIEAHTFAHRSGGRGVHLVDVESAPFDDFECVQLVGLVDGEWPERPRRNIFYSPDILRDLGWPSESDRRHADRARFNDLLRLPSAEIVVSTFSLDGDTIVNPSPLVNDISAAVVDTAGEPPATTRIFNHEALGLDPLSLDALTPFAHDWATERAGAGDRRGDRFRGFTVPRRLERVSVSALERYQDCPFAYFSAHVLKLEEESPDESGPSPKDRGRSLHDLLRRFFEAWDGRGGGPITAARLTEARTLFADLASPLLERLDAADATLERMRLFGSPIATGVADVVLGLEVMRPTRVIGRWLEHRLDGAQSLDAGGTSACLTGVADRIDLLPDRRIRVFDYKSGVVPDARRALQVPVYAMAALQQLQRRDGHRWTVDEAAYVGLARSRRLVSVIEKGGAKADDTLESASSRVGQVVAAIERGEFPPRPHAPAICRTCAFSTVCRKDIVRDE